MPKYVVVTPVRNEVEFIDSTIQTVLAQTVRPLKWIVASDGSTDGTDDIVARYAALHPWIELLRMPEREGRTFAGKARAFNAGMAMAAALPYEALASLDADVTFENDFFPFLLEKLAADPRLGVVGTRFHEESSEPYDYRFVSQEHVSGPCQMFRRECLEAIGGYAPSKYGAVDIIAVITARMKGWQTRTYTEKVYFHHRKMGTAQTGLLKSKFRFGVKDYMVGNHPVWELFRCTYQMTKKPLVLGGMAVAAGYLWTLARREPRPVSREFVAYLRRDQLHRLRRFLLRRKARGPDLRMSGEAVS